MNENCDKHHALYLEFGAIERQMQKEKEINGLSPEYWEFSQKLIAKNKEMTDEYSMIGDSFKKTWH